MKLVLVTFLSLFLGSGIALAQGRGHANGHYKNGKAAVAVVPGTAYVLKTTPNGYHGVRNARRHGGVAHAYGLRKHRSVVVHRVITR